jgi:hypothetical protein
VYKAAPLLVLVLVLEACGSTPSPTKTAREFAALLDAQSYGAAWALLSEESRARLDRRELERRMRENPEEREILIDRLSGEVSERRAEALYPLADGRVVRLVLEDGEWKLDGAILDVYSQETPRLAIASFARALRNRRYDVLLRFVPRAYLTPDLTEEALRKSFEEEMPEETASILQKLEDSATTPIEENGDRARMSLGGADSILLLREDGAWKIDDLY